MNSFQIAQMKEISDSHDNKKIDAKEQVVNVQVEFFTVFIFNSIEVSENADSQITFFSQTPLYLINFGKT